MSHPTPVYIGEEISLLIGPPETYLPDICFRTVSSWTCGDWASGPLYRTLHIGPNRTGPDSRLPHPASSPFTAQQPGGLSSSHLAVRRHLHREGDSLPPFAASSTCVPPVSRLLHRAALRRAPPLADRFCG